MRLIEDIEIAATRRSAKQPLYLQLAQQIRNQIRNGSLRVGDKVPSIRSLRRQRRVSSSTVLQAYLWLENRGWIEARPRSGFYVRVPYVDLVPERELQENERPNTAASVTNLLEEVMNSVSDRRLVALGATSVDATLYPSRVLNKTIQGIIRRDAAHSSVVEMPHGTEGLRRQIARRAMEYGCTFNPDDVIVTCGATEALNLALRAVARPGDTVAIESPTSLLIVHVLKALGINAIEIPMDARGMDVDALSIAIRKHAIRACVTISNCHDPLGVVVNDFRKKHLVNLLRAHEVPLIEDDSYGDLAFTDVRPKSAKAFDTDLLVLSCSSFSKVLGPGFRVGWIEAGRYRDCVKRLKFVTTAASPTLPQRTIAQFIESGGYERYVRGLRETLKHQIQVYRQAVVQCFPAGTQVSEVQGGYYLWLEIPGLDALAMYRDALSHHISILPGMLFSAAGMFKNSIRLSCGQPWNSVIDSALITLGRLADKHRTN
jgi:DNA-binding transcriptional MocR family regulator